MKDANDLLIEGVPITSVPTVPIELYCAEEILARYPSDKSAQYRAIDKFIRTVPNELVKGDIAVMLAERWNKTIEEVRKQFAVSAESPDERLQDFADIYGCFSALDAVINQEEFGIGYPSIDKNALFRKKWVVILGAYSFSGKTTMLVEWMLHWCVRLRKRVLFFSLEMPKEDVVEAIIGKVIGKPQYAVRSAISADVYRQVAEKLDKYLYIIDKNGLSIEDIANYISIANTRIFEQPVDIVAVDYYQYLRGTKEYKDDSHTAQCMKEIAKEHNITLVMLSQFNKESQRTDKKTLREPTQNDLKGAGDIGASADVIYLMWRPALMGVLSEIDREHLKYETRVKIAKIRGGLRNGQTHFKLKYDPATGRLEEANDH